MQPANTSLPDSEVSAAQATLRQPAVVHALITAAASLERDPRGARAPARALLVRERILRWLMQPDILLQFCGASPCDPEKSCLVFGSAPTTTLTTETDTGFAGPAEAATLSKVGLLTMSLLLQQLQASLPQVPPLLCCRACRPRSSAGTSPR